MWDISGMRNISSFQSYRHCWKTQNLISRSLPYSRQTSKLADDWMRRTWLKWPENISKICINMLMGAELTKPGDHRIFGIFVWLTLESLH